jgi:Cu+-exporting ATPase
MVEPIKLHPERTDHSALAESGAGSPHARDHAKHSHGHVDGRASGAAHRVKDPVCGMTVDAHATAHRAEHDGHPYYFCSATCRSKFVADPMRYSDLAVSRPTAEAAPQGAIYTCPMHPQIRQVGPGNCPICGMALEPVVASAETGPNLELIDMTRRLWIRSRAPIQRLADQVSGWFVPAVIVVSVLAFGAWAIWGPEPRLS